MPRGIYIRTDKMRQNMSETHKGKHHSAETKLKMSEAKRGAKHPMWGKHQTAEANRKNSEAHKDKRPTAESLRKGSESRKGFQHTEETKQKISRIMTGVRRGIPRSEETRRKISEGLLGDKHPQWRGGISFVPYSPEFNGILKKKVKKRDGFFCQLCGEEEQLCIHHIDYNKMNSNPQNLITLCRACNSRLNINREEWQEKLTWHQAIMEKFHTQTQGAQI